MTDAPHTAVPPATGAGEGPDDERMRSALNEAAGGVRRFVFGMCGDWDLAEDLAQESLLKAWAKRATFAGRSGVRTWLFTIARNAWRDRLRRKRTRPESEPMDQAADIPANTPDPSAPAMRGELAAAVHAAMERLPDEQREVLALRESEGLTFAQIAELLDIPLATAKSRARYALLKLSEDLHDYRAELDA